MGGGGSGSRRRAVRGDHEGRCSWSVRCSRLEMKRKRDREIEREMDKEIKRHKDGTKGGRG